MQQKVDLNKSNKYQICTYKINLEEIEVEELVKRAKNKDEEAFDELILSVKKEMYLIAKTRLYNDDDIADAIQETIYLCYKNIHKLKDNKLFKAWLIKILINECNKVYKKRRKYNISFEYKELEKYIKVEENYENIDFDILIRNLDTEEKTILTLYYCSGYTTKEISKILKKNENTIRSKIYRSKEKLKKQYGGKNNG